MALNDFIKREINLSGIKVFFGIDILGDFCIDDFNEIVSNPGNYPLILCENEEEEMRPVWCGEYIENENGNESFSCIFNIEAGKVWLLEGYDGISALQDNFEVSIDGKKMLIDIFGNVILSTYDYISNDFDIELSKIVLNDKEGLITKNGEIVIPPKYDYINNFEGGFAVVEIDDTYGLIDRTGKEITPIKYDYIINFFDENGYAKCNTKDGDTVFVDKQGNEHSSIKEVEMYYKMYEQIKGNFAK